MTRNKPSGPATPAPVLAVFGVPRGRRRPVGARFAIAEAEIARWVARQRGLRVLVAEAEPALSVTAGLRDWEMGVDGRALLPVIPGALWANLCALAAGMAAAGQAEEADPATAPDTDAAPAAGAEERLALAEPLWAAMAVGDTVLAPEFDGEGGIEGWWEATILAIAEDGGLCTLCWLDDPEWGFRKRQRTELAPLHPSSR